jgi:simple sugar transport system permease protein
MAGPGAAVLALVRRYGSFAGALTFFVAMMLVFLAFAPAVFTNWYVYAASFISLPIFMFLVVPEVFLVTCGEIDLSFPGVVGMGGYIFSLLNFHGLNPLIALSAALAFGVVAGVLNSVLVVYLGLSALVVTLGMMFLWEGLISVLTSGNGIALTNLTNHSFYNALVGSIFHFGLPVQMIWGVAFGVVAVAVFSRHRFGAHIACVGDNIEAAKEMGINVMRVKSSAFVFMGVAAAFAGVISVLIDNNFYSDTGQDLLLPVIAAVFVGGTPGWGGRGSVGGALIGACTVTFIETGLVGVGLGAYYTGLFYGLVITLSLIGHRFIVGRFQG